MVANETNQKKGIVATVGRWMPIHNGHKAFLIDLARTYEKVVVMIGSCYENGTFRNCIPAVEREKMLNAIFQKEEIPEEKYEIIHLADAETFEEWIDSVRRACIPRGVTHFCTGNQEDILNMLKEKGEELEFEMINPELNSKIRYHATDVRQFVIEGNYEKLKTVIPREIMPVLFRNSFKEIIAASKKTGIRIIPGRQTVDMVFLVKNISDDKVYVLLGKRSADKIDFPGFMALPGGAIDEFESPIKSAIRNFYEETGLEIQLVDNSLEPAIVRIKNVPNTNLEQMFIVGIYSSEDTNLAGTRGGSSQCFGVFVEDEINKYQEYLTQNSSQFKELAFYQISEAKTMELAYQHSTMLIKAITMFKANP